MPASIAHPWFENGARPLYVWRFPTLTTDQELSRCLEVREKWAAHYHGGPCAWVVDVGGVFAATAVQRKLVVQHLKRFDAFDREYTAASAIIVPRAIARGIVTGITWMVDLNFPLKTFQTEDQAFDWARRMLDEATG